MGKSTKNDRFSRFSAFYAKQIHKMYKITSYFYDLRKILTKKFWSQGTPLGSLGPGSQEALGLGPCQFQILVIWGPYDPPVLLVFQTHAKNPNTAGARCVLSSHCWPMIFLEFTIKTKCPLKYVTYSDRHCFGTLCILYLAVAM